MFTTRPEIAGTFGVVASTHWIASSVGMAVLERGGNAFDAAAAAAFILQIAEPHLNGPGGDVPIIIHSAKSGTQHVICGQGVAPDAATPEHFAALGLDLVPGTGLLPAVVPGAFDAWALMLRDWGTMELADVLAYAIGYAQNGIHIVPRISAHDRNHAPAVRGGMEDLAPPCSCPAARCPGPGRCSRAPRWPRPGSGCCAKPPAPRARPASMPRATPGTAASSPRRSANSTVPTRCWTCPAAATRGLLTEQRPGALGGDRRRPRQLRILRPYRAEGGARGRQGPVLLQQLALLHGFDIGAMDPQRRRLRAHAGGVRETRLRRSRGLLRRPRFRAGAAERTSCPPPTTMHAASWSAERASLELRPGKIPGYYPWVDHDAHRSAIEMLTREPGAGEPTVARLGALGADTCHIDVIDRWGNMVSATPSGGWLQSSPVVPELGFCVCTRGQMFWTTAGQPNSLAPRKRPRTTLTPSMVLRDGKPWMAFGTPGGDQQDQWQTGIAAAHAPPQHGHPGGDRRTRLPHRALAVAASGRAPPRPGKLVLEGRYDRAVLDDLTARGHTAEMGEEWTEGRLSGARIEPDGQMFAGANPRGMQGYAVGR